MIKNSFMKIKISLLVFFSVFGLFFCCNANAEMISADNLYKMALQTGLRNCYDKYAKDVVSIYSLDSYEKFFDTTGDWKKTDGQDVWIPTHVGNDLWSSYGDPWKRDSNLSCEQLFKGYESGKQKASGLLQLFQFPQILSSNMGTTWGYKLVGGSTPTTGETTPDGNKVKITITEGSDSSGANKQKITTTGEIICTGVEGGLTSAGRGQYNWILNCEGEINASYRNEKIYTVRATYSKGRKWRAVYWDGHSIDDDWRPASCSSDEECYSLDWGETNVNVEALQSAALNVHASDFSNKSVLEILNGDARNLQEGGDSLTYRLEKMTESVFKSIFANPSFEIKVEAVDDGSGGGSGGGGNTTNYEPIFDKKTAGEIFSYSLGFDESLPHSSTIINDDIRYNYYIWNSTAKYSLYYRYLLNMMNLWPGDIVINGCSESKPTSGYYFKNKINEWCDINIPGSLLNTEPGVTINIVNYTVSTAEDSMFQLGEGTFGDVLEWFKKESSYTGIPEDAYARGQVGDDGELDPVDPDPGDGGSGDPCYGASGAMGWIVCPVVTWLGKTIKTIYGQAVEPMLQIKSELFNNSKKGGQKTYQAWEIFRNIANIMFVVLFLVVIISQLTGVGIDNYGIKKILPKLIVAAVLINLSYIICQLAVDVSNIAGAGLNGLLSSQAAGMSGMSGTFNAGTWFEHVLDAFLLVLGVGGITSIALTVISGGLAALLLPLLMGFITAFVAVLFFFALLGMRQAGVVILVVTSPVAFACYMLPNTKKLFDKWLKLFEGLLILYPICGLLVGGSTLSSTILISGTTDFFIWLIGLLLMVVPFFFIPTLLKGSFAAMGSVGAKITGWGSKFGKGLANKTDGTIKNTDAYKSHEQYRQGLKQFRQDRHAERRAQRIQNRLGGRANLSERQRYRLAGANQTLLDSEKKRRQNAVNADGDQFSAAMAKQDLEIDENAASALYYNDANYVEGKRRQGEFRRDEDVRNTMVYNDAAYRTGKAAQSRLAYENDVENAIFYTRPGVVAARTNQARSQRESQYRSDIRKGFSDRYATMAKKARQDELTAALRGGGTESVEQADAAFDSLMATGDVSEVLQALDGADYGAMDAGVRERIVAKAAASGNLLMKAWAKQTGGNSSLSSFISDTGNNGLSTYLAGQAGAHAFDNADKDTLRFLADHHGAQAMSDAMIANIALSSANANQTATRAAIDLIRDDTGRVSGIAAAINAEGLTKMSYDVADALGPDNLRGAITDISAAGNETMRSKVDSRVRDRLGINQPPAPGAQTS